MQSRHPHRARIRVRRHCFSGEVSVTLSPLMRRATVLAVAGVALAFAWILAAVLFGLAANGAHAADDSDGSPTHGLSSLVGSVLGTVDDTVSTGTARLTAVTDAVDGTLGSVTDAATTTVTTAPVIAPVVKAVTTITKPVLAPVEKVVKPVVQPVTTVIDKGVVTSVVQPVTSTLTTVVKAVAPVVSAVEQVPVVGDVVSSLDLNGTLQQTTSALGDTLTTVTGAVDHVASGTAATVTEPVSTLPGGSILQPAQPPAGGVGGPGLPSVGILPGPLGSGTAAPGASTVGFAAIAAVAASTETATAAWFHAVTAVSAVGAALVPRTGPGTASFPPVTGDSFGLGACAPAGSCLSGSGGFGAGVAAVMAVGFLFAHRAWTRSGRLDDAHSPVAPTYATDVSPD